MVRRINKTQYAILGMLSFSDKSGYEISKAIQNSTAFFWSESDGQLYPILKRLCEEDLIRATDQETTGRRAKKIYQITEDGEAALQDWLLQEPTTFNIRNEFLLQLFFGHNVKPEYNIEKIKNYQRDLKRQLNIYSSIENRIKKNSKNPTYLLLSLSYGQYGLEAEIKWCDDAISLLEKV